MKLLLGFFRNSNIYKKNVQANYVNLLKKINYVKLNLCREVSLKYGDQLKVETRLNKKYMVLYFLTKKVHSF